MTIFIKEFTPNALSENAGSELRKRILSLHEENPNEDITLDFEGITLYATMFFNASIGFLIKENKTDIYENLKIINITPLGKKTFEHSKENALFVVKNSDIINNIISEA